MRKVILSIAILAAIGLLVSAAAPAHADPGGDPEGANGTVKVHDWPDHKNASDMANDPKVCRFELHGFKFDSAQAGSWWIQEHKWGSGDSSQAVLSGTYAANGDGDWTSGPHSLPDGHYKLFVEMRHQAGNSGKTVVTYKHKVFKVECQATSGATSTPTPTTTPTPTPSPFGTSTPAPTSTANPAGVIPGSAGNVPGGAVAGVEQAPGGGSNVGGAQAPGGVAGQQGQVAGQPVDIATLPNSSTASGMTASVGLLLLLALGMRRRG